MAQELTSQFFETLVGKSFSVQPSGVLQLISMEHGAKQPGVESFSLLFHSPVSSALVQGIYTLQAEGADPIEIFLVPLGPSDESMRYEAVFNRVIVE